MNFQVPDGVMTWFWIVFMAWLGALTRTVGGIRKGFVDNPDMKVQWKPVILDLLASTLTGVAGALMFDKNLAVVFLAGFTGPDLLSTWARLKFNINGNGR